MYRTILADPPWRYYREGTANRPPYPMMSTADICALDVPAADDAVLFLWATWPCLPDALRVMDAWRFEYKSGLPWVKADGLQRNLFRSIEFRPFYGCGFWIRGCSEPLLIGKRGDMRPQTSDFVGLLSPNAEHSRKPADVYELAEQYPGPRLEMFARRKRDGWDVWGNEVESNVEIDAR